ncbi:MAG TPA: hypothetical protein VLI72_04055 [Methylibium sp.]|nr:hypothetical protein [Methylibium sp.]
MHVRPDGTSYVSGWTYNQRQCVNERVPYELSDRLDLDRCPQFDDKASAARMTRALGLKSWRYVRL